jgi:hypothetical protein
LIAGFEVLRPLRLLDLAALDRVAGDPEGSMLDPDFIRGSKRREFLRGLSRRISRPVMPDNQPLDFVPTQAIADFLANWGRPPLDGIIYPSVQIGLSRPVLGRSRDMRNVVLFQRAARVQELDIPTGTEISVSNGDLTSFGDLVSFFSIVLDDGPDATYEVSEEVPSPAPPPDPSEQDDAMLRFSFFLEAHHVLSIRIESRSSQVTRRRVERQPSA